MQICREAGYLPDEFITNIQKENCQGLALNLAVVVVGLPKAKNKFWRWLTQFFEGRTLPL